MIRPGNVSLQFPFDLFLPVCVCGGFACVEFARKQFNQLYVHKAEIRNKIRHQLDWDSRARRKNDYCWWEPSVQGWWKLQSF